MIIVKLWGGLGNQLFQYAYGYMLAKKNNVEIILDVSWFQSQNIREPEILKLNITYDTVVQIWEDNNWIRFLNKKNVNRLIRIPRIAKYKHEQLTYLKESRYRYIPEYTQIDDKCIYIDGYWQCPKYFQNVRQDLLKRFVPKIVSEKVEILGRRLQKENSVAIHVRRGDYPSKKHFGSRLLALTDDYYKKAIQYMISHIDNGHYYLFSNDIQNAKKMLLTVIDEDIEVISQENMSALDEWYLMSCCQNQIIGNSTFSWWAAYLNSNANKTVCAPDNYWGNDEILLNDWIRISV